MVSLVILFYEASLSIFHFHFQPEIDLPATSLQMYPHSPLLDEDRQSWSSEHFLLQAQPDLKPDAMWLGCGQAINLSQWSVGKRGRQSPGARLSDSFTLISASGQGG